MLKHHHGKGLGEKLINYFINFAKSEGFSGIAGITFKSVHWNGPYYQRLGFDYLDDAQFGDELRAIKTSEIENALSQAGERVVFGKRF